MSESLYPQGGQRPGSQTLKFELVLPCYNESQSLEFLITRARGAALTAGLNEGEFRLVMVENGSKDNSRAEFARLRENKEFSPWFTMVPIDNNQGYGYGLSTGLKACTAPIVGWSHADQQCDPADAVKAYFEVEGAQRAGHKILVKGVRSGRNWKDIIVSRVFELVARVLLGLKIHELNAQPKVFSRELLNRVTAPPKTFAFDLYVLYQAQKAGLEIRTIPVVFPPRVHGLSNWSSHFLSRYKTILGMINYMWALMKAEGRL